uniref:Uncharacterized protein n=1 Tax=Anguilla anguilla TaxID=7936 RepID=A0A0E9TPM9_ANGAN
MKTGHAVHIQIILSSRDGRQVHKYLQLIDIFQGLFDPHDKVFSLAKLLQAQEMLFSDFHMSLLA